MKKILTSIFSLALVAFFTFTDVLSSKVSYTENIQAAKTNLSSLANIPAAIILPPLDIPAYNAKLLALANLPPPKPPITQVLKNPKTGQQTIIIIPAKPMPPSLWPVKTVYPGAGAILPFKRIVAYYGNLYSTGMGVLGQYPEDVMLQKLQAEVANWTAADPSTPAIPALHYIAVVAQGNPGADGKYRDRMPDSEIDKVIAMAVKINALVFLDVQVGFSTVQDEVPRLDKYLKMPLVNLGIDAEFSMKNGIRPGKVVGTFDAADINFVANHLATLVRANNLPPKILIVHRYTEGMITNYKEITPLPEVQIVMNMDGWGDQPHKLSTYRQFIAAEPVQFTGFKLFYKNDVLTPGSTLFTPAQLLKLSPQPSYIQYQ